VKSLRGFFPAEAQFARAASTPVTAGKPSLIGIASIHDSVAVGRQGFALWGFWQQSVRSATVGVAREAPYLGAMPIRRSEIKGVQHDRTSTLR
jgi:hypothetical protein